MSFTRKLFGLAAVAGAAYFFTKTDAGRKAGSAIVDRTKDATQAFRDGWDAREADLTKAIGDTEKRVGDLGGK